MAVVAVKNLKGEPVADLELADEIFAAPANEPLLWEAVRHYRAAQRQGTVSTKTRGVVSGGGKKPWRQKGTGRARVGSSRNPIWVHGGTVFGPLPRDYDYAFPRKKRRGALRTALSAKLKDHKMAVVEDFRLDSFKTQDVRKVLDGLGLGSRLLIVNHDRDNVNLLRGARNLPNVTLVDNASLNLYDVLRHDVVVFTRDAVLQLQEALKK
ncbi:MAG: 50S ribosomal protein L4 [Acidobacteria bacterium]|nr:50S ribosomal protein L4 [Acidobacteriota bacterium]